ncbi:phosphatidylserine decarboxylase [candidate division KSB3 bacterium]|uniref:phosphatidylserine decarboxylase n=1 Tax=candidate division KSB3 bacterium TaxID=2044937 RepID=A0A2G6E8E5_9BACT|nr:MAG: phosphatidylserine decarboxylase [candidate division KSB3 bacterium]PIE30495.1 MAG: phosphatidylserine decarboxylase [candidate division KSB3 bacterium]
MQGIYYIDRHSGALRQEIVPGERWLQWLYQTPVGTLTLHAVVKRAFLSQWYGWLMNRPASRSKIKEFVESLNIDLHETRRPLSDFNTFNEFFIRELTPEARPIDRDPDAIVSPADGKVLAFSAMSDLESFFVKGQEFSKEKLLKDRVLREKFADGPLIIIRLAPGDYHRIHFPTDGYISASTRIHGNYYSVSPYAVKQRLRIYWENVREYSILESPSVGAMLICEVGATLVGSIVQNYTPETDVLKGCEKGWFAFGGSTVILLFEAGRIRIDRDLAEHSSDGYETSIKMGERLACALSS